MNGTRDLKPLRSLFWVLKQVSNDRVQLVKECFEARKPLAFDSLAHLSASRKVHSTFFFSIIYATSSADLVGISKLSKRSSLLL
jgi:hypothetical protein